MFSKPTLTKNAWFFLFGSVFAVQVFIYFLLHFFHQGEELIPLTKDITNIQTIIASAQDTNWYKSAPDINVARMPSAKKDSLLLGSIKGYLIAKYPIKKYLACDYSLCQPSDSCNDTLCVETYGDFDLYMDKFREAKFTLTFIEDYKLKVSSYFWLTENGVFFEIIFWTWFGVFASLFYYVSEAIRDDKFKENEIYVHFGKLLYSPVTSLIIYFSIEALISDGEVSLNNLRHGLIVLSFILGFFSGRTIELLNKLKDIVLPLGKKEEATSEEPGVDPIEEAKREAFQKLDDVKKEEIFNAVIIEKYPEWKTYPGVTGVSTGKRSIKGIIKDSIIFQVVRVQANLSEQDKLPKEVAYQDFLIPTFIEESGTTLAHTSVAPNKVYVGNESTIRKPGCGISRVSSDSYGTFGLKVFKREGDKSVSYILSCYHVIFAPELGKTINKVEAGSQLVDDRDVVCPAKMDSNDAYVNIIAKAEEGCIDLFLDAAIARIINDDYVEAEICNLVHPRETYRVGPNDNGKIRVRMQGRSSGLQTGTLVSSSSTQTVQYFNGSIKRDLYNLIQVTKLSVPGDSGAAVLDDQNRVIGLVVGSDDNYTYLISINRILQSLKVTLS